MKNRIGDAWMPADQSRRNVRCLCASLLLVFVMGILTLPVHSNAAAEPVAIQLKTITLPGISEKGYRGRTGVTPYVLLQNEDVIERFCGRWPRVVDAILIAFENAPLI